MTEYKPVQECAALLDALEAELLAAPADEVKALAARRDERPGAVDRAIAAALDGVALPPGVLPFNRTPFAAPHKSHH
jgi:hypothetical protein